MLAVLRKYCRDSQAAFITIITCTSQPYHMITAAAAARLCKEPGLTTAPCGLLEVEVSEATAGKELQGSTAHRHLGSSPHSRPRCQARMSAATFPAPRSRLVALSCTTQKPKFSGFLTACPNFNSRHLHHTSNSCISMPSTTRTTRVWA